MEINFLVLLLGLVIGVISAVLGVGGGILIVPILPMIVPLTAHEVVATSLLTIFIVGLINTAQFYKHKLIVWNVALILGPITAISAFLSGKFTLALTEDQVNLTICLVYAFLIAWTFKKPKQRESQTSISKMQIFVLVFTSLFAGVLSGMTGLGSGVVLGSVLINLHLFESAKLSPTLGVIIVFTTFSGVLAYMSEDFHLQTLTWGKIHIFESLQLVFGAMISSYFAVKHQHKIPGAVRKKLLLIILIVLEIKIVYSLGTKFF